MHQRISNHHPSSGVIDSGANESILLKLNKYMHNFKKEKGFLRVADNTSIPTIGTASYGILDCIICPSLAVPLISVISLIKSGFYVLFEGSVALIIRPLQYIKNDQSELKFKLIATARLNLKDNLYHVDDMSIFLDPKLRAKHFPLSRANAVIKKIKKRRRSFSTLPPSLDKLSESPMEITTTSGEIPVVDPLSSSRPPITPKQFIQGSYRTSLTAARYNLNIIEWLHLILGHLSEKYIRWIIRSKAVRGLKVTSEDIKNVHMRICYACLIGKMKAFPAYRSLNDHTRKPLRKITSDYKIINTPDYYGRTCYFLFADVDIDKWWFYSGYSMTDWLSCFQQLLESEEAKTGCKLQIFQTDFNKMPVSESFTAYLTLHKVEYQSSAPYKKEQSLSESQIQIMDNGIRASLTYNQANAKWWAFAGECFEHIRNNLPQYGKTRTRNDEMYSSPTVTSDVSSYVPFYSKGIAHLTPDERLKLKSTKALDDRGVLVRFIGYASEYQLRQKNFPIIHMKNTYIVYREDTNVIEPRHDCVFPGTTDLETQSFDIGGIDSFDKSQSPAHINRQIANEKTLLKSYDLAFGKWKSHHWNPIKNINDPNVEPLFTIVPRFDYSDQLPGDPEETIPIRIDLDDYGFVKQSPQIRLKKKTTPASPHSSDRPQRNKVLTPAGQSFQQSINRSNRKINSSTTPINPLHPSALANLSVALEKSLYQQTNRIFTPTFAANICQNLIPIDHYQQTVPDFIIQKRSLDDTKQDIFDICSSNLSKEYRKKIVRENRAIATKNQLALSKFKSKLSLNFEKVQQSTDRDVLYKRQFKKLISKVNKVGNRWALLCAEEENNIQQSFLSHPQTNIPTTTNPITDEDLAEILYPPTKSDPAPTSSSKKLQQDDPLSKDPNETLSIKAPTSLLEAFLCKEALFWYEAWIKEMERVEVRKTFQILSPEDQSNKSIDPIKSKYAFRLSLNSDGSFKFKVRLVACGYSQRYGRDFNETFSPTSKFKSFTTVMHLAAVFNWEIHGFDVENAFIETDIDIPIHMYLPSDVYRNPDGSKVKTLLLKSLYGLKQAGELFYQNLRDKVIKAGYTPLIHDKCVYIKRNESTGSVTIIICYVDDVIVTGNDPAEIAKTMSCLGSHFTKITETGNVTKYVGIEMKRDRSTNTLTLHQTQYVDKLIYNSPAKDQTSKDSPLPESVKFDKLGDNTETPIRDRVGTYRFLADRTRPSILEAVGLLGQASHNPTKVHTRGCNHLDRFLLGSRSKGIKLGGSDRTILLFAYSDASYISGATRIGYCFFLSLDSGTIFARSTNSNTVSHSSTESEIKAIDECIRQLTWMRGFLAELGFPQLNPTEIKVDNKSAIFLADKFQSSNNTAHIVTRLNYIHQEVTILKNIRLTYINTEDQVADILTKLLPVPQFLKLEEILQHGHRNINPIALNKDKNIQKHQQKPFDYKKHNLLRAHNQSSNTQLPLTSPTALNVLSDTYGRRVRFAETATLYRYDPYADSY